MNTGCEADVASDDDARGRETMTFALVPKPRTAEAMRGSKSLRIAAMSSNRTAIKSDINEGWTEVAEGKGARVQM